MILRKVIQLTVLDTQDWTGFYAVDFRFQVVDSEFQVSGIIESRIRDCFQNLNYGSKAQDSGFQKQNFLDSGIIDCGQSIFLYLRLVLV